MKYVSILALLTATMGFATASSGCRSVETSHSADATLPPDLLDDYASSGTYEEEDADVDADNYVDGDVDADLTDDVYVDDLGDENAIADQTEYSAPSDAGVPSVSAGPADALPIEDVGAIGASGERADCASTVVASSAGAVGDACATSESFMRSLGLTDFQIDAVLKDGVLVDF